MKNGYFWRKERKVSDIGGRWEGSGGHFRVMNINAINSKKKESQPSYGMRPDPLLFLKVREGCAQSVARLDQQNECCFRNFEKI